MARWPRGEGPPGARSGAPPPPCPVRSPAEGLGVGEPLVALRRQAHDGGGGGAEERRSVGGGLVCAGHGLCADGAAGNGSCACDWGYAAHDCRARCPGFGPERNGGRVCGGHGQCQGRGPHGTRTFRTGGASGLAAPDRRVRRALQGGQDAHLPDALVLVPAALADPNVPLLRLLLLPLVADAHAAAVEPDAAHVALDAPAATGGGSASDASEGEGPQRWPQRRLGRRLEEVAKAVGGGYCRLQMPLRLALAVRGTVAGHRRGALERGGGGGGGSPPFQCIPGERAATGVGGGHRRGAVLGVGLAGLGHAHSQSRRRPVR